MVRSDNRRATSNLSEPKVPNPQKVAAVAAEPPATDAEQASSQPVSGDGAGGSTLRGAVAFSGVWGLSAQVITLLATLAATPLILRLLGPVAFGVWSLIQSTTAYFVLANAGMGSASTKLAGDYHAAGDAPGEAAVVWMATAITATLTGAAALAFILAAPWLAANVLQVPPAVLGPAVVALRLAGVAMIARSVVGTVNTPQTVRLRWASLTLATQLPAIVQTLAAPLALLVVGGGLIAMGGSLAAGAVLAALANATIAVRLLPALRRPRFERRLLGPLVRYGGALTLSSIAAVPLTNAERFLLGHADGAVAVAHYAVANSLAGVLLVLPFAVVAPLFPALVRLHNSGDDRASAHLYHQAVLGVLLVVTPAAILLGSVAGPFLGFWAGSQYAQYSTAPFVVLLVGVWFNALMQVPYNQLLAVGRTSTIAKLHFAELVPYIALAAGLTALAGTVGAALAFTLRVVADCVFFFLVAPGGSAHFHLPLPGQPARWCVATIGLLATVVAVSIAGPSVGTHLAITAALGALYGTMLWRLVLTVQERHGLVLLRDELFMRLRPTAKPG